MISARLSSYAGVPNASQTALAGFQPPSWAVPHEAPREIKEPFTFSRTALEKDYVLCIEPALKQLGFSVEMRDLKEQDGEDEYNIVFTLIRNGGLNRILLQLPDELLSVFRKSTKRSLIEVRDIFQFHFKRNWSLYLCHKSKPHETYITIVEQQWRETYGIISKFVHLETLKAQSAKTQSEQMSFLKEAFDLDLKLKCNGDKMAFKELPTSILEKLWNILANLDDWDTTGHRRTLLDSAGLKELRLGWRIEGAALETAKRVITDLYSEPSSFRALFAHLIALDKFVPRDSKFVTEILETYDFS